MSRQPVDEEVSVLQREIVEIRRRRAEALEAAERDRTELRRRMRRLKRLGAEIPAAAAAEEPTEWKPPTEAPELPRGWRPGPPDFVGVGAQKAGTTWWFQMLASHPEVHPPLRPGKKELHYLSGFPNGVMTQEQVDGYYARLPRPPGHLAGEWTPGYMAEHWVPRLLAKLAPAARLLVILRDPVERYRSAVSFPAQRRPAAGGEGGGADAPAQGATTQVHRNQAYRGFYCAQLRALLQHFPREQLLVQQYERCRAEPEEELRRAWEFVGVDPGAGKMPDFSEQVGHKIATTTLATEVQEGLLALWAEDLASLGREFPEVDLALWPSARNLGVVSHPADGPKGADS